MVINFCMHFSVVGNAIDRFLCLQTRLVGQLLAKANPVAFKGTVHSHILFFGNSLRHCCCLPHALFCIHRRFHSGHRMFVTSATVFRSGTVMYYGAIPGFRPAVCWVYALASCVRAVTGFSMPLPAVPILSRSAAMQ